MPRVAGNRLHTKAPGVPEHLPPPLRAIENGDALTRKERLCAGVAKGESAALKASGARKIERRLSRSVGSALKVGTRWRTNGSRFHRGRNQQEGNRYPRIFSIDTRATDTSEIDSPRGKKKSDRGERSKENETSTARGDDIASTFFQRGIREIPPRKRIPYVFQTPPRRSCKRRGVLIVIYNASYLIQTVSDCKVVQSRVNSMSRLSMEVNKQAFAWSPFIRIVGGIGECRAAASLLNQNRITVEGRKGQVIRKRLPVNYATATPESRGPIFHWLRRANYPRNASPFRSYRPRHLHNNSGP